jgi:hypothetical protein
VENLSPNVKVGSASATINRKTLELSLDHFKSEFPGVLLEAHNNLFSNIAIIITAAQMAQMRAVIAAVEKIVVLPAWQQQVLGESSKFVPASKGVFFGYDFHLNAEGAHLIEINTNAGGAFLSDLYQQSQQNTALPGKSLAMESLPQVYVEMFRHEWQLQRGNAPLHTIAIVDEAPQSQYFYPEFVLARQLFETAGIQAIIADPADFEARADGLYMGGNKIDLIYNRLTDFSLEQFPALLNAYQANQVVLTPQPYAYALYADKRNLSLLTDSERLRAMGADEASIATLQAGVPQTRLVDAKDTEQWWKERKDWFFKPATGYGGRGSYRGDKLTQRVFGEIVQGGYVAQRKAMPGEVLVSVPGAEAAAFKYDVRCYVYEGQVQLVIARLYQGQTTNFRTAGGGFALVRVEA